MGKGYSYLYRDDVDIAYGAIFIIMMYVLADTILETLKNICIKFI